MKNFIQKQYSSLMMIATLAFIVTACSTTGMQRSEQVQKSMQTVDNDISSIVVQLDAINSSLDELTKPGQADRRLAFDLFSENVSKIKKMEDNFAKHSRDLEKAGDAYFASWDKDSQQYDNPEIQRRSDERRDALGNTYDKIEQNNVGVKEAFRQYVSDVNEIERFLSNDLTSEGIESISVTSNKVVNNGEHLRRELRSLQTSIEEARAQMRQN